jgi:hypothetical protein
MTRSRHAVRDPSCGSLNLGLSDGVSAWLPVECDVRTSATKELGEPLGLPGRDNRIASPSADEYRRPPQVRQHPRLKRDHGTEKHGPAQDPRASHK